MNLWPLFSSFMIIAAAELGDKTQLLTLGFATRYPLWEVMGAVSAATAALMLLAVSFGGVINHFIPELYLKLAAGILFIVFGIWTVVGKEEAAERDKEKDGRSPFLIIFSAFFLAELGDKTQLATLTLSAESGTPFQVWLGATLGMVLINAIGAFSGSWIKKMVSEKAIKWLGAAIFIIFGLLTLASQL